ncbi:hypothetical protein PIB30_098334 [Stylosanthes scabra]|uniref:Uncharacterized protein n=1 Tax=Stylosanthes scabra TaxID=79078 RepID=A0ABU6ZW29_9FABA|nr:hypothetical protein [Stylosanthes scabra]
MAKGSEDTKLLRDLKVRNLQKVVVEEERAEAMQAKLKAEGNLKNLKCLATEEKVRADLAVDLGGQCDELPKDAIYTTEGALKAQLAILGPDFNASQVSFFKDIVDGKVADPAE